MNFRPLLLGLALLPRLRQAVPMKNWFILILTTLVLQGCATMSVDQCATADWHALGYQDGSQGATLSKAAQRDAACTKHGFTMNRSAYSDGRYDGLHLFCTPNNAYSIGERGKSYSGVCTDHNEDDFLDAYQRGRELYSFTGAVTATQSQLNSAQSRRDVLDAKLNKYWSGYRDEGLTTEEHNTMVLELWAERKYLRDEAIPYWQYAHRFSQEQLAEYRAMVNVGDPAIGTLQPRRFPGPEAYTGPSQQDAREMLREVFSSLGTN